MLLGIRFRPDMHLFTSQRRSTNYTVGNGNTIAQLVSSAEQQETATADILDKDAELGTRDDIEEPRWRLCVCFEQTRCN